MIARRRCSMINDVARIFLVPSLVFICAAPVSAQFQLDIVQMADSVFPKVPDEDEKQPQNRFQANVARGFDMARNIDSWIFNRHRNADKARQHLNTQLKLAIEGLDRSCNFSDLQKEKLHLAGRGDITLFFTEADRIKEEYRGQNDQNKINEALQRVRPLQVKMQSNFFGSDSIMSKVSKQILSSEQTVRFQKAETERRRFAYRAAVKLSVANLERVAPLRAEQRTKLVSLLGKAEPPKIVGNYINYYVMYELSRSKDELEKFLDEGQLRAMSEGLNQGRAMKQMLTQQGYIE